MMKCKVPEIFLAGQWKFRAAWIPLSVRRRADRMEASVSQQPEVFQLGDELDRNAVLSPYAGKKLVEALVRIDYLAILYRDIPPAVALSQVGDGLANPLDIRLLPAN